MSATWPTRSWAAARRTRQGVARAHDARRASAPQCPAPCTVAEVEAEGRAMAQPRRARRGRRGGMRLALVRAVGDLHALATASAAAAAHTHTHTHTHTHVLSAVHVRCDI